MSALDEQLAHLSQGASLGLVLAVALLLGLRHASDLDHLAAVSTLIASSPEEGTRKAGRLGFAWSLGHATTLVAFGLPIVLFKSYLPRPAQTAAEAIVGLMIVALALRLLVRWRRSHFHAHLHRHGTVEHRHLHAHDRSGKHEHAHESVRALGRTPVQAFAIGMVHGTGGSAGLGVLLLAGLPSRNEAAAALVVFALAAAVSMTTLSLGFGYAISRERVSEHALTLAPIMGTLSLIFGAW